LLADYGESRSLLKASHTLSTDIGTLMYMAPELIKLDDAEIKFCLILFIFKYFLFKGQEQNFVFSMIPGH
jgi:serine/threonine protein kinase